MSFFHNFKLGELNNVYRFVYTADLQNSHQFLVYELCLRRPRIRNILGRILWFIWREQKRDELIASLVGHFFLSFSACSKHFNSSNDVQNYGGELW